jgi:hypothetical protein
MMTKFEKLAEAVIGHSVLVSGCLIENCNKQSAKVKEQVIKIHAPLLEKMQQLLKEPPSAARIEKAKKILVAIHKASEKLTKTTVFVAMERCKLQECGHKVAKYVDAMTVFLSYASSIENLSKDAASIDSGLKSMERMKSYVDSKNNNNQDIQDFSLLNIRVWFQFVEIVHAMDM